MSPKPDFRPRLAPTQGVGPDYRTESQKPTATVSTSVAEFVNVTVLPQTPQLIALLRCVVS
jgi:uracil phosphoribosyltransferase